MTRENNSDPAVFHRKSKAILTASELLDREPTEDYLKEWTDFLRLQMEVGHDKEDISVVVFRLGHEWLAMNAIFFKKILEKRPIHRIPHRVGKILLGIINLDGELQLCVALNKLLGIESSEMPSKRIFYHSERMIAINKNNELWICPVDEVEGIYSWRLSTIGNVPVNVAKSTKNYLKGIMSVNNKNIGLLDEELLFYSLRRSIQ